MSGAAAGNPEGQETVADEEGSEEMIDVYGPTARGGSTAESISLTLVVGTGETKNGETVLVPYVECDFIGSQGVDEQEPQTVSVVLTIDNAAFAIEEFATEFRELMRPLASLNKGDLRIPRERITYIIESLGRASTELASATEAFRNMLDEG